jgi:hypothetical protein
MNKVDHGKNDHGLLARILGLLQHAGFSPLVFGGWAQELLQLAPPRPHLDVDLLLRADSFTALDQFVASAESCGWSEIKAKRFAHKRAFLVQSVMVELTLVEPGLVTRFWGDVPFYWLDPLPHSQAIEIDGVSASVVSAANLLRYQRLHRTTKPWRWREQATASDQKDLIHQLRRD